MSNYSLKYQMQCEEFKSMHKEASLAKDLSRAIQDIKFDGNIWNVSWKNTTFSIKPFLCSALSFLDEQEMLDSLCSYVVNHDDNFYNKLSNLKREDYYSMTTDEENDVFGSILYQLNSQIPCVARYLVGLDNDYVTRHMMGRMIKYFTSLCGGDDCPYIKFNDKDVCNTQAFSVYISIYWILQKSKKLQLLLRKEISAVKFREVLDCLCPETSVHFQYLSGVISAKELRLRYVDGDDKTSPVIYRELYNLMTNEDRTYDEEKDRYFLGEFLSSVDVKFKYEDFVLIMGYSYFSMGFYSKLATEMGYNIKSIEDLKESNFKLYSTNKELKSALKAKSKEVTNLQEELSTQLKLKDTSKHESTLKKLESDITDLKIKISSLERISSKKDYELLKQKRLIRSQIKEIKSLRARLDEVKNEESLSGDISEEVEDECDVHELAEALKGYKIGVFGGFDAGCVVEKFKDYGLSVKHIVDDKHFVVGDLDCAVVLTSNIQHKTVRVLKSQYDGNFVYFNGTSIELIIKEIYNLLVKEYVYV